MFIELNVSYFLKLSKPLKSISGIDFIFPLPDIVTVNVIGWVVWVLVLSKDAEILYLPTAPLKFLGFAAGRGKTVISIGLVFNTLVLPCEKKLLKKSSLKGSFREKSLMPQRNIALPIVNFPAEVGNRAVLTSVTAYFFPSIIVIYSFCGGKSSLQKPFVLGGWYSGRENI